MNDTKNENKLTVSVVGASGYAGGELARLLLTHPRVNLSEMSSERFAGVSVSRLHPNLRHFGGLKFVAMEKLKPCDLLFVCLPHGETASRFDLLSSKAPRIIDLSADFRLKNQESYDEFYNFQHPRPELLPKFVSGLAELYRDELKCARFVACAGCNATVTTLSLYPLFAAEVIHPERSVVEVKVGSSEGGRRSSDASHHPERSGCVRSFKPTGHRHLAEIEQHLSKKTKAHVYFSVTSVEMVRGALATAHVFLKEPLVERDIWQIYREYYGKEPFVRIVKSNQGIHRYPEPKLIAGSNFFDVGFERDLRSDRLVVIGAIDNLMKGAAGQAVQAMNAICDFAERTGLEFPGLHPV